MLKEECELKAKQLKILNEEHTLKIEELQHTTNGKIKEIKKDVQQLQAEAKKLLTRAEKYKKIKYDRR